MLPALVFLALAIFAVALVWSPHASRAATLHLILATGAMPLIFGAMSHFIPVLTRTRTAATRVALIPLMALAGGAIAVAAFGFPASDLSWHAGALLALAAAIALLIWSRRRRLAMVGRPHPCLAWYETALACLIAALLAVLAGAIWPHQAVALRHLHLHLNTLGFIGLTALGTLAVLLPTVAGKPDPETSQRLRRDLPWAAGGAVSIAVGSMEFVAFFWIGGILLAMPVVRLATRWLHLYRQEIFAWHGAAPLLAAALSGFALSLLIGALRATPSAGAFHAFDPAAIFGVGFLLPLVAGAASQLLPVWLRPGVQNDWHEDLRRNLGRHGGMRAALFLASGIAAGLGMYWGPWLGLATLIWFFLQAFAALVQAISIQRGNPQ